MGGFFVFICELYNWFVYNIANATKYGNMVSIILAK